MSQFSSAEDVEKFVSQPANDENQAATDEGGENEQRGESGSKAENDNLNRRSGCSERSRSAGNALIRVITARSNATVQDPGDPPDGGLKAWTQAFMGHFVVFNTWGIISSYGVFQSYYTSTYGFTPSSVSWIGSVQMFFHFSVGMFSGRALDAGYFHWVLIPGVILGALALFLTPLCSQYWQFFVVQGVVSGIGYGMQFTPAMSLVTTYFSKNRSLAVAVVASGSATGGLVYPTIMRQILPKLGFAWAVRVMGFIMVAVGALYCSLLRPRLPPRKSGPLLELAAFRETPYTLYCAGVFLVTWGQMFAFYYVGAFGLNVIGIPYSQSVNLLMIMNGMGVIGRIIPNYLADLKFGPFNTIIPFAFITGILGFFWALVDSPGGLYAFATVYGLLSAGFQGLFPATMSSLTKDMRKAGVRNGMGFAIAGVAALTGPPIAGALIQVNGGHYRLAQMWAGSVVTLGGVVLVAGRISKTGWVFRQRV